MIKIFADGANIEEMLKEYKTGKLAGFTTNPTLMRKAGVKEYKRFAQDVLEAIPDLPISFEVFADDFLNMYHQAKIIAGWGENVYVKIPVTTTKGWSTASVIQNLSEGGVKVNVTAVLTITQVDEVLSALSNRTPSIISIFAGRIADTGRDPNFIMKNSANMIHDSGKPCECLWASCREVLNIFQAEDCGCDIITVPNDILAKAHLLGKDLTQLSLETVRMFYEDAKKSGYTLED